MGGDSRLDYDIGCVMVTQPVFFDEDDWIRQPADWPRNVVAGMHYDLTRGEGRRVWEEVLERAPRYARRFAPAEAPLPPLFEGERFGTPVLVEPRLGQGTFRIAVAGAYGRACAVTGEHTLPALEAAHIQRYSMGGAHRVSNGILLRADIHRLFDHGYVTITPDYVFRVSRRNEEVFKNGRSYQPFRDREIHLPGHPGDRPDPGVARGAWGEGVSGVGPDHSCHFRLVSRKCDHVRGRSPQPCQIAVM